MFFIILVLFIIFLLTKDKSFSNKAEYSCFPKYIRWKRDDDFSNNQIEEKYILKYEDISFSVFTSTVLNKNNKFMVSLVVSIPKNSKFYKENKFSNEVKPFNTLKEAYNYSDYLQKEISVSLNKTNYFQLLLKEKNILVFQ